MLTIEDPKVQNFLNLNVTFLQDLEKVKLSSALKISREELLRLSTEFVISPEPDEEEVYGDGDEPGIYGEFTEEDENINIRASITGDGARILNLHATFKGWLRDSGWIRSKRWWCLVYDKNLLLYTDANTNENPSRTIQLTKETKVRVKGSDKLLIEVGTAGKKTKRIYEFKVESGDIKKWQEKLEDQIHKPPAVKSSIRRGLTTDAKDKNYEYDEQDEYDENYDSQILSARKASVQYEYEAGDYDSQVGPSARETLGSILEAIKQDSRDSFIYDDVNEDQNDDVTPAPVRKSPMPLPPSQKVPKPPASPVKKKLKTPPARESMEEEDLWPPPLPPVPMEEPNYVNDGDYDDDNGVMPLLPPKKKVPRLPEKSPQLPMKKKDLDEDDQPPMPAKYPVKSKPVPSLPQMYRPSVPNEEKPAPVQDRPSPRKPTPGQKPIPNPKPNMNLGGRGMNNQKSDGGRKISSEFMKKQEAIAKALGGH